MRKANESIGKYDILESIGSSLGCEFKLGRDRRTGGEVALKIFKDDIK